MMKKLMTIGLACLLAATVFADEIDRTIDASPDGHVDVSNIAGSVTIDGWTRNEIAVTGTLGRNVEQLILERNGDKVTIKVKVPKRGGRGIESDLRIRVPQDSSINIGTVSADIVVANLSGEQSLHTVSGDVSTEFTGADLLAETVSGDIEIAGDGAEGEVSADTVSGNITLFRVSGEVEAGSISGDLIIDEGSFSQVDLGTVNGEIFFQAELRKGGDLTIDSLNGDVDVDFIGDVSAEFDIDTFNGRIRNCFGAEAERTGKYAPGWELEFTVGDGDSDVEISTMNGDVDICHK